MGARLGIESVLYLNGGTYGSPTWGALTFINDLTVNNQWDKADANSRASRIKQAVKTLLGLSWTGTILVPGETNADYTTIIDAMNSDDILDIMVLNGPNTENGVRGYRCDVQVTNATEDQGSGAVLYDQIEFMPTPSANPPKSVLVTSGAPVFSALPG